MNMHEIEEEITRLENMKADYNSLSRLAVLYSIKDHQKENRRMDLSHASSEFAQAISGAPIDEALEILDEHFDAIKLIYPKEYEAIIRRINNLKLNN